MAIGSEGKAWQALMGKYEFDVKEILRTAMSKYPSLKLEDGEVLDKVKRYREAISYYYPCDSE